MISHASLIACITGILSQPQEALVSFEDVALIPEQGGANQNVP